LAHFYFAIDTLRSATLRGIKVSFLLESRIAPEEARSNNELSEKSALEKYEETGAIVLKDLKNFKNVHAKALVGENIAIVGTTNYTDALQEYKKKEHRDFAAIIKDPEIVEELKATLQKVFRGEEIHCLAYHVSDIQSDQTRLSWTCQTLEHLLQMIQMATHEIIIYQQDLTDERIVDALCEKAKQGIIVQILMSEYPFGKEHPNKNISSLKKLVQDGAQVRLTGGKVTKKGMPLHIHAKILLVDGSLMYLGSANFYPSVLDPLGGDLNVGIVTRSQKYILPVIQTFKEDWLEHEDSYLAFLTNANLVSK
jgi:phosphatidylserine/phosphatidylglycerophosphate/cardiolipin synthase-like enzyme